MNKKEYQRQYYQAHKAEIAEYQRQYYQTKKAKAQQVLAEFIQSCKDHKFRDYWWDIMIDKEKGF